ncbi:MAG: CsbD family protein [Glutamicibacter ardleyensis]|uniref:CsbD family protein n=1 Tax=Glutamicibacter ardleyensis TaxID=225894 RepID=UPI003F98BD01
MGVGDKIQNKTQEVSGKAKESIGDATDNERLQAEGAAHTNQAAENGKDAAKDVKKA